MWYFFWIDIFWFIPVVTNFIVISSWISMLPWRIHFSSLLISPFIISGLMRKLFSFFVCLFCPHCDLDVRIRYYRSPLPFYSHSSCRNSPPEKSFDSVEKMHLSSIGFSCHREGIKETKSLMFWPFSRLNLRNWER